MVFRKFEYHHIPDIKRWSEHDSIKSRIAIDDWDEYYEYANNDDDTYLFAIYDGENFVGEFTTEKDDNKNCLHIALIINPQFQRRGLGTKALNYFKENVQLLIGTSPAYIHAGIENDNIASVKCFSRAGYVNHGTGTDGEECYLLYL